MGSRLVVALATPLLLLASAGGALAAPEGALAVLPDPDLRALVGTILAGIAGGIVLALNADDRS